MLSGTASLAGTRRPARRWLCAPAGRRGCPLHKLLVVRSAYVYRTLHAVGHAFEVSVTFNRAPETVYEPRSRCRTRVVGAYGRVPKVE